MTAMQHSITRGASVWLLAWAVLLTPMLVQTASAESPRDQARKHYEAGRDLYSSGDYRAAIREFDTANRLAPSPVLDFNIGLARERLGQLSLALEHYRRYISAMPNAGNRAAVDAKIASLEKELAAGGATAPANPEVSATTPATDPTGAGATGIAGAATAGSGEPPAITGSASDPTAGIGEATSDPARPAVRPPVAEAGTPSGILSYEPTGDRELDRVAMIDIGQIRDQRAGAVRSAPPVPTKTAGHADFGKKKAKPAYKKWWFWAIIGVSTIILVDLATGDNGNSPEPLRGPVLMRF